MADALVSSLLRVIFGNLNSVLVQEFGLAWGFKKELQKLESTLSTIQPVIHDAEEKQTKSEAVLNWLRKLKDVAYDADDVLDEIATEALVHRPEISGGAIKQVSNFFSYRNPILFRFKMAHKIINVVERLDEIAGEKAKFHFREGAMDVGNVSDVERRHTSSFVIEPEVYGRDEEKEKIIQLLLANVNSKDDISIYAIFGMGGLGKTTIAQVVYNDERVKEHFELNAWVCVSEEFDIKRLTRAIIESTGGTADGLLELDPMQCRLREILKGKRFLLVLDDVWNEKQEEWEKLKSAFRFGASGSSIIVTTRIEKIAMMMATIPLHQLKLLSKKDSWSLFERRAFDSQEKERNPNLVMIGEDIVQKCGGIPLAIKALGGLLRFKGNESDWIAIKESEMWDLPDDGNDILPSLRLSYKHLPSHLRQCFASCCIFPKDYLMDREYLIQLWMANGFIPSRGQMDLEDVGNEILNELLWRSFFQDHGKDKHGNLTECKMHDLMHDLATCIMRNEVCIVEQGQAQKVPNGLHHFRYVACVSDHISWSKDIKDPPSLRSFNMLGLRFHGHIYYDVPSEALRRNALRMLDFRGIDKWSIPISRLKHLRYLDLSWSSIKLLPESFTCLQNLLTLKLEFCREFCKLPKNMRHMINLRHLSTLGCNALTHMPRRMGLLTDLQVLDKFIVGKDKGQQIEELKDLHKLSRRIQITDLQNVKNPTDAKKANLASKTKLDSLSLEWRVNRRDVGDEENIDEKVLESLRPHTNLERLCLDGYNGTGFPYWMRDMMLPNLVEIDLTKCNKCEYLPSLLGKLLLLETLKIDRMNLVKVLYTEEDHQLVRDDSAKVTIFPSLKTLFLIDMMNLEDWTTGVEEGRELLMFPRLEYLRIVNCPSLRELLQLQTLGTLEMIGGTMMVLRSVESLTSLTSLYITNFKDTVTFPDKLARSDGSLLMKLQICSMPRLEYLSDCLFDNLTSLDWLEFYECKSLTHIPEGLWNLKHLKSVNINGCGILSLPMHGLEVDGLQAGLSKSLQRLSIENCSELTSLSDGLQYLTSLGSLTIKSCPKLTSMPGEWLESLASLCYLSLGGFHDMTSLPEGIQHLASLRFLEISSLKGLFSLPQWLGNLTLLSRLYISNCDNISSLPEQLQLLTALESLDILGCPHLQRRCKKRTGVDWYKIAHIPDIRLGSAAHHKKGFNPLQYNCLLRDPSSGKACWPQF